MTGAALARVESGPEGAPLVALVHGSMDRMAGFAKLARRLEVDHRVLRYDRRGYAQSLDVGPPFTIERHALDLIDLLDGRPAVVVGHSLGGNVALAAAERAPSLVRAVVLYESPFSWQPWWPTATAGGAAVDGDPADAAERFLRRMIGDALWERLPEATRSARRAEGEVLVGELTDLRSAAPWRPEGITVPVIASYGELGHEHHKLGQRWLSDTLGCPLVEVPGARHNAHSTHPDALADLVARASAASA